MDGLVRLPWGQSHVPLLLVGIVGCGAPLPEVAYRAGDGAAPGHSPAAIAARLSDGDALHVQLFLAGDRVPLLWSGPSLDPETCETVGGRPLDGEVWLVEQTAAALQAGWRCGARPHPQFPDAALDPFVLVDLDAFLEQVAEAERASGQPVDLTLEPLFFENVSHDPEVIAAELVERWRAHGRTDPIRLLSDRWELIEAVGARAAAAELAVEPWLRWPTVPPLGGEGLWSLGAQLGQRGGLTAPLERALDAGAVGLSVPVGAADRAQLQAVSDAGLAVQVGPVADGGSARALRRWPVDSLLVHQVGVHQVGGGR
jgi:hypothetical protein